ncbi:hypothetical protein [Sinanaerobacter chloroacetimidivorans]|uniref:Vitamin B12 dependent methionine synthase, activation domain n=1 Tax=Sinanaerobacter chloroacetimidivorans TaxID=2818044 RepID=A0A8J7W0Y9_9FIRM|nr:hypothetical protein [Sinanaerobacter chloroacetimidivorans]MBR0598812.1 hypothetical protein [Sinanaerobacter chloroacetimidivorans]
MKNQIIPISMEEADVYAIEYFLSICGFQREGEKYKRLAMQGMEVKDKIKDRVRIQAIVSSYSKEIIEGNTAVIEDVTFVCNAFEQLNRDSIQSIYAFILTAGIYECNKAVPMIEQLYADIWGTAYVDAGLEVLKNRLLADVRGKGDDQSVSAVLDSFGPGYYGMEVDQIGSFFKILNGGRIDVTVRDNCLMLPLKSCAGFFIAVDDETKLPSADCKSCRAEHKGCAYCQVQIKKR